MPYDTFEDLVDDNGRLRLPSLNTNRPCRNQQVQEKQQKQP